MPARPIRGGQSRTLLYSRDMAPRVHRTHLADHLLAETIRRREEAVGHPEHSPEADARARAAGGDLRHRILERARHLPDAPVLHAAMKREGTLVLLLVGGLMAAFALAGSAAARAALVATGPVSVPLALLLIVGPSLATLLLWLFLLVLRRCKTPLGIATVVRAVVKHLPGRHRATVVTSERPPQWLSGRSGSWILSGAMHLAWIAYVGTALITLALLLSVRSYTLAWETTLLDEQALRQWAEALSLGPALLGLAGAESLPLRGALSDSVREAWAAWLLAAVGVYGLLPRLLALLACAVAAVATLRGATADLSQPGYARLRARLMPSHGAEHPVAAPTQAAAAPTGTALPAPRDAFQRSRWVVAIETDLPAAADMPAGWQWLGRVDDLEAYGRLRAAIAAKTDCALALAVRAGALADRGTISLLRDLLAASDQPGLLLLLGTANEARLRDWHACARQLQVPCAHLCNGVPVPMAAPESTA